jgi:hypothetical protein
MSIVYCHYCECHIDTDFDAEHFDCETDKGYECIREEEDNERRTNK